MTSAITSAPSLLSLVAANLYGMVALVCLASAVTATRKRQQRWHLRAWTLLALMFGALAALRIYGAEEALRNDLRHILQADGIYSQRRSIQRPIAALTVVIVTAVGFAWTFLGFRRARGRRNLAVMIACASAFSMIGIVTMRLVSLSPIDALLYGPIKLNWIIDLGSSLGVLASAAYYVWLVGRMR